MEEKEIWKDIEGYEGLYQVSNLGRVKSFIGPNHCNREIIKTLIISNNGYLRVGLCKNSKLKYASVHRLIAKAFIPNPDNLPQINHKDENKTNNFVWINEDGSIDLEKSNLEWCTQEYNNKYGTHVKRVIEKRLKPVIQMTLDERIIKVWASAKEAEKDGFLNSNICSCCKERLKTYKGYKWKYA